MVKDRLAELHSVVKQDDPDFTLNEEEYGCAVNTVLDIENEDAGYMAHFFSEVEQSRLWIANITEHIRVIKTLHSSLLSSPREDEKMKLELDARTETVKQIAKKVNSNLKALERGIKQEEEELGAKGELPVGLRIRKTQHATTLHLLVQAVTQFNAVQVEYKEKCEERIQRIVSIAKAEIPEEKLEELLEQGSYGSIFNGDIITDMQEAKKVLEDVQVRHQELLKLEKSIVELKTLFVEMALLVEQQGDVVNSIEHHVQSAGEYVAVGKSEMKKAVAYRTKTRTKRIILIVLFVVLGALVVTFLYSKLKGWGGQKHSQSQPT